MIVLNEKEEYRKKIILSGLQGVMTNRQMSMNLMITVRRICQIKSNYKKTVMRHLFMGIGEKNR
jgi:hypothetical protein